MENIFVELLPPWIETGLQPAFYDKESGTVLQQVARMYAKVNELIKSFNDISKDFSDLYNEFVELHDYVNDYFDNLDVQEEINNKLDAMVEAGTLQEIIGEYLNATAIWGFDTVADMKASTNLIDGSYARTLGYYEKGDGGAGLYKITDTGTANEMNVIAVGDLYANLVISNQTVNIKQLGAKGDGTTDDGAILTYALVTASPTVIKKVYLNEKYLIASTINIASNKDVIGIKSNIQGTDYSPEIIANSDIKFIDATNKSNIKIENVNFKHINTQSADVIDLTRARYVELKNVRIYQPDNSTNCTAIAINDTNSSSDFSGYFTFDNVTASYHKIAVKSRATYITMKNCNFNHSTDYAIWLTSEGIGGIKSCNMTGSGIAVRYDGTYMLDIQDCYMEGYYLNECVETTNNVPVNMKGCKVYERQGQGNSVITYGYGNPTNDVFRNTKNSFVGGYASTANLTLNGNFKADAFWGKYGTITYLAPADMPVGMGLPAFAKGCYHLGPTESGNNRLYQKINKPFRAGEEVTIGIWVFTPTGKEAPLVKVGYTSDDGYSITSGNSIIYNRPTLKNNKWIYFTAHATLTTDVDNLGVQIQASSGDDAYVCCISLMKGIESNIDCEYTPNEHKVITDNLIIKGSDDKYYQIGTDGTNISFTEIQKPQSI